MAIPESIKTSSGLDLEALVSPRDIAEAIGASESSLRRWIDGGDIRVSRTAGGHRRVPLREALQFIRRIGAVVVRPEVLRLPAGAPVGGAAAGEPTPDSETDALFAALSEGRRDVAGGLALAWYLKGRPLHEFFDGPVSGAMHRVGELWRREDRGILVEHRATEICLGMIGGLRSLLPRPVEAAPLAIGGAPEGDPYQIPSRMAGAVLAEAGWRDMNFGAGTPLKLLADEAALTGAKLVWLSISATADARSLQSQVKRLATALAERGTKLAVGGHAAAECLRRNVPNVFAMNSMGGLAAFSQGLLNRPPQGAATRTAGS